MHCMCANCTCMRRLPLVAVVALNSGPGAGAGGAQIDASGGPEPCALEALRGLPAALAMVEAALSVGQHLPQMLLYRSGPAREQRAPLASKTIVRLPPCCFCWA